MRRLMVRVLPLLLTLLAVTAIARDEAPAWRPITPAELAMNSPKVEADADAEAIFWDIVIDDKKTDSVSYEHYVRVKIFTKKGQERFSKFDIPFAKWIKLEEIAARVIRPDGSIQVLDPKDILEREIVKAGRIKVKAKSFAVPGIEPGVIVEYRYKETYKNAWSNGGKLWFQRDIPVQKMTYRIRPQKGYRLNPTFYNMKDTTFREDSENKGFFIAESHNVPSYKAEANMPPEDEVRRWAFVSYWTNDAIRTWQNAFGRYRPWLTIYSNPTDLITRKANELLAGAASDEEKLRRIYNFVQKEIRNVDYDRLLTDDEREKLEYSHAEDALKRKMANSIYVNLLFGSLVRAAGFEIALIFAADRSESFFSPEKYPYLNFVQFSGVAVKTSAEWRYFNAGVPFAPFGSMPWNSEGTPALHITPQTYGWRVIPVSTHEQSPIRRSAKLSLAADGTLDGTVRVEYLGHPAIMRRQELHGDSDAKRKESVEKELKERISTMEVSDVTIEYIDDASKPLVYAYRVRVPGYAQRTGQRLFVQPGFFEYGVKSLFATSGRQNSIHFPYPWSEKDDVEIRLPQEFEPEYSAKPMTYQDPGKIGTLKIQMNADNGTNVFRYQREFAFGRGDSILFPATAYPALKNLFDTFHTADSQMITLRQRK